MVKSAYLHTWRCVSSQLRDRLMSAKDLPRPTPESLQEENLRLKRAVGELSILNELALDIGASFDSQGVLEKIVNRALHAVNAEQGVIVTVHRQAENPTETLVRAVCSSSEHPRYRLGDSILGWMRLNKQPLLINDPRNDHRFLGETWDEKIDCLISAPLMVKSELVGILTVYNKKNGERFNEADKRLLAILASQSAQIVENARLHEEEKQLLRMNEEVMVASRLQRHLLPEVPPAISGYEIAGKSIPARKVGGDYFDFIQVDDRRLVICLGDVCGKGLPASLLMANLQATIRAQSLLKTPVKECLGRSNSLLYRSTEPEKFASLFYGILDFRNHLFRFSNAGHNYPFLISQDGDPLRLQTGGPILGILEDCLFDEQEVQLSPGDLLMAFSDGISDAIDDRDEQFGEQRLATLVRENMELSAQELIERIVGAVELHCELTVRTDDMTVVVVKRTTQ